MHRWKLLTAHRIALPTRCIFQSTRNKPSHYQTLRIKQDANAAEIKAAFFELSKQLHPDVNPADPSNHEKFVQLSEAYSVLSSDQKRRHYDINLGIRPGPRQFESATWGSEPYYHKPDVGPQSFQDKSFWENRDKSQDSFYKNHAYYGIKGVPRLPNFVIALCACAFLMLGVIAHVVAISKTAKYRLKHLDDNDRLYGKMLSDSQEQARALTRQQQLDAMRQRITEQSASFRALRGLSNKPADALQDD